MLEIYGRASSSNVQKVLWLCEELGLPYRTAHDVPPGKAGTDDYKRVNPTGKIPTLIEPDGFTLWESNAILRYLGAKHAAGNLWPNDLRLRADVDRWMDWQNCAVAPVATIVLYQTLRAKPEEKNPTALAAACQASRDAASLLDAQLNGKAYIVGDAFTLADIALGQWVWRYVNLVEQRPDQPHLVAWYARLQDRAAYKKIVMTKLV